MKTISIQIPDERLTKIDEIIKKWGIKRSEYFRECDRYYQESENRDFLLLQELSIIKRKLVDIDDKIGSSVETNINNEKEEETD